MSLEQDVACNAFNRPLVFQAEADPTLDLTPKEVPAPTEAERAAMTRLERKIEQALEVFACLST